MNNLRNEFNKLKTWITNNKFAIEVIITVAIIHIIISFFWGNSLDNLNNWLMSHFSIANLGIVSGLTFAVLLPITIALLDMTKENDWDRAAVLKYAINFNEIILVLCIMSLTFLFWDLRIFCYILLSLYFFSLYKIVVIFQKSVNWILDWSNSSNDGIRFKYRSDILVDKEMNSDQRLKIYYKYLTYAFPSKGEVKEIFKEFSKGDIFVDIFRKIYANINENEKSDLLSKTRDHINIIFRKDNIKFEDKFLEFEFTDLIKYFITKDNSDNWQVYAAWTDLNKKEIDGAATNWYRSYILFKVIKKITPNYSNSKDKQGLDILSSCLINFLWIKSNNYSDDSFLEGSDWNIDSKVLNNINDPRRYPQYYLLKSFWKKIEEINNKNISDKFDVGHRIDNLISVTFKSADPIILRRLYCLFHREGFYDFDMDWSEYIYQCLTESTLFGIIGRSPHVLENISEEELIKKAEERSKAEQLESVKIVWKSFFNLRFTNYRSKVKETLFSEKFKDYAKTKNYPIENFLPSYKKLFEDIHKVSVEFENENIIK